jgi:hypothetical protein
VRLSARHWREKVGDGVYVRDLKAVSGLELIETQLAVGAVSGPDAASDGADDVDESEDVDEVAGNTK